MTIYEKPRSEVFASNAPESEISTFTAWLRGLGIAFDETNGLPEMKGLNNVFNLLNQYIKYLEQNGFAEWSPGLEYPIGAGVRVGAVWYRAKTQNTSKPPATSQNDWELFLNASALTYENPIYIENNVVKVRGATQTQSGVVQFANAIEIFQKASVSKVVNPANVATIAQSTDFGVGQEWSDLTSQRLSGVSYENNTGRTIFVSVAFYAPSVQGITYYLILTTPTNQEVIVGLTSPIPHGYKYRLYLAGTIGINKWSELR